MTPRCLSLIPALAVRPALLAGAALFVILAAPAPAHAQAQPQTQPQATQGNEIAPGVVVDYTNAAGARLPAIAPATTPVVAIPTQVTAVQQEPVAPPAEPGTAAEQGLVDPLAATRLQQLLEDAAARSSARQRGLVVPAPTLANPVATDPVAREWLMNWEFALVSLGMSRDRVRFEASRLSREDFAAWASRQFRFRAPSHQAIEILDGVADAPLSR